MGVVAQVMVAAGGSWWDMLTVTHTTLSTNNTPVSHAHTTHVHTIHTHTGEDSGATYDSSSPVNQESAVDSPIKLSTSNNETNDNDACIGKENEEHGKQLCTDNRLMVPECFSINVSYLVNDPQFELETKKSKLRILQYRAEGLHFAVFLKELRFSDVYRRHVLQKWSQNWKTKTRNDSPNGTRETMTVVWRLTDTTPYIIDDRWCVRMNRCAQERQYLDTSMSWLSTLGGACSALGDYSSHFALRAGAISLQQMDIAVRVGEPSILSRCRLYAAISFIQQCKFKLAKSIIRQEYYWVHSQPAEVRDNRVAKMCRGIWTKMAYERNHIDKIAAQKQNGRNSPTHHRHHVHSVKGTVNRVC